jgi:hypothetical protein
VFRREAAPSPIATTLFHLTSWCTDLEASCKRSGAGASTSRQSHKEGHALQPLVSLPLDLHSATTHPTALP